MPVHSWPEHTWLRGPTAGVHGLEEERSVLPCLITIDTPRLRQYVLQDPAQPEFCANRNCACIRESRCNAVELALSREGLYTD